MKKQPSKLVLQLTEKIEKDIGLHCNPNTFKRTGAGHWQLKSGAYSWSIKTFEEGNHTLDVFSCDTVTECVRRDRKLELVSHNLYECVIYAEKKVLLE